MIYHTFGEEWDHYTISRMSELVRSASAFLINNKIFTREVDKNHWYGGQLATSHLLVCSHE